MKGCVYRTASDLCKKFTTDHSISFCVGKNCPDRKESNADRIRSMTDEELANILDGSICPPGYNEIGACEADEQICKSCWLDWLKEESGEK